MGRKKAVKSDFPLKNLLCRIGVIEPVPSDEEAIVNLKADIDNYLIERCSALGAWHAAFLTFFAEARSYYKCSLLQRHVAQQLGFDPTLADPGERRKFFKLTGGKLGFAENSGTIRTWVNRTRYPKFDELDEARLALDLGIEGLNLLDDIANVRFALARAVAYVNAYPWQCIPQDAPPFFKGLRERSREEIMALNIVGGGADHLAAYLTQPVLDVLLAKIPELPVSEEDLSLLEANFSTENIYKKKTYSNSIEAFQILKTMLLFGKFDGGGGEYHWLWDEADSRYKKVWGYA